VRGNRRKALRAFVGNFKDAADVKGRLERMKELFSDHKNTVSDVFKWNDPLPALGFLFSGAWFSATTVAFAVYWLMSSRTTARRTARSGR
jgi:predicted GNAT superfamily acetyltransferase